MDLTNPATVLCQPTMGAAIGILAGADVSFTGRQIARMTEAGSVPTVLKVLRVLVEHGLVQREVIGRTHLYRLNREHVAAPAVEQLADIFGELLRRIRKEVSEWEVKPRHVSLFGSAARRDGSTRSDLDLLVVRPTRVGTNNRTWREQLDRLERKALAWSGNRVAWFELSARELLRAVRDEEPIADEWLRDGVRIAGLSLSALLRKLQ